MSEELERALERAVLQQRERLMTMGQAIVPRLTEEDLLQPNDYPALEFHPLFRYEEGILEGMLSALALLRAERSLTGESLS